MSIIDLYKTVTFNNQEELTNKWHNTAIMSLSSAD